MTEPIRIELPTIYGMKTVNCYLFTKPEPVLVDCGEYTPKSWEALQTALSSHQLTLKDIKKVIITHAHVDHIGMAGKIARESNAQILVNEYCYDWAVQPEVMRQHRIKLMKNLMVNDLPPDGQGAKMKKMLESFSEIMMQSWVPIPPERINTFPVKGHLEIGPYKWKITYAPGHSITQTCFFQEDKGWFLSADAILNITPTPVFDFKTDNPSIRENSLSVMIQTHKQLADLPIKKVFPGHYKPFENHDKIIALQLKRIQQRKEKTFELITNGKNRFFELFDILYVNRLNMPGMSMLRGYLDLLIEENRIQEQIIQEYTAYIPT